MTSIRFSSEDGSLFHMEKPSLGKQVIVVPYVLLRHMQQGRCHLSSQDGFEHVSCEEELSSFCPKGAVGLGSTNCRENREILVKVS